MDRKKVSAGQIEISRRTVSYGVGDSGWAPHTKARGSRPPGRMGSGVHTNGPVPPRIRLMIYAQDGLGLGHMRRTTSIAAEFIKLQPDAVVLTVEDSPLGNFFRTSPNHDYVKLPSIKKIRPRDWRAALLPLRFAGIRAVRAQPLPRVALDLRAGIPPVAPSPPRPP